MRPLTGSSRHGFLSGCLPVRRFLLVRADSVHCPLMKAALKGKLSELDRLPGLAFGGLVLGVLGLVVGVVFYYLSLESRKLAIVERGGRTVLVERGVPRAIDVRVAGKPVTDQDVYAVQYAIWNKGNRAIRPEHVLESLEFVVTGTSTVAEASVLRQTRALCKVQTVVDPAGKSVKTEWAILEPGDGAVLQFVLVGGKDDKIGFRGASIEAGGKPIFWKRGEQEKKSEPTWSDSVKSPGTLLVVAFVALFALSIGWRMCFLFAPQIYRDKERARRGLKLALTIVVGIVGWVVGLLLLLGMALAIFVVDSVPSDLLTGP